MIISMKESAKNFLKLKNLLGKQGRHKDWADVSDTDKALLDIEKLETDASKMADNLGEQADALRRAKNIELALREAEEALASAESLKGQVEEALGVAKTLTSSVLSDRRKTVVVLLVYRHGATPVANYFFLFIALFGCADHIVCFSGCDFEAYVFLVGPGEVYGNIRPTPRLGVTPILNWVRFSIC